MTSTASMAKAITLSSDGAHTRALLSDNAASAREARQARLVLDTYRFEVEPVEMRGERQWQVMMVTRDTPDGADVAWVERATDTGEYNAYSLWPTDFPLSVYVDAVRMRCAANRAAAQEAGK